MVSYGLDNDPPRLRDDFSDRPDTVSEGYESRPEWRLPGFSSEVLDLGGGDRQRDEL